MTEQEELKALRRLAELEAKAAQSAAPTAPKMTFSATEGMGTTERTMAGIGQAATSGWRGLRQLASLAGIGNAAAIQREVDEAARLDRPLLETPAGMGGSIGGTILTSLLPGGLIGGAGKLAGMAVPRVGQAMQAIGSAVSAPRNLLQAAPVGAAFGAAAPVGTGESRFSGALMGGAGASVLPLAGAGVRGIRALSDPLNASGQERIAARIIDRFASDPASVARATATEIVPGSVPTLAQATGDTGLSTLEAAMHSLDPRIFKDRLLARSFQQNQARLGALRSEFGDDAAVEAARQAREIATKPLYAAAEKSTAEVDASSVVRRIDKILGGTARLRTGIAKPLGEIREKLFAPYPIETRASEGWAALNDVVKRAPRMSDADMDSVREARMIMSRLRKGSIDVDEAADAIKGLPTASKTAGDALDLAQQFIRAPDYVVETNPKALRGISLHIGDMINARGPTGAPVNEAAVRELRTVKKLVDDKLGRAVPEFAKANKAFRDLSRPIEQMEIGQEIVRRSTNPLDNLALEIGGIQQFAPAIRPQSYGATLGRDRDLVRQVTGFKRAKGLEETLMPQQWGTLQAVKRDLEQRGVQAAYKAGARGSPTAQYLGVQDILSQVGGPLGVPNGLLQTVLADSVVGRPLNWAGRAGMERVNSRLADLLLDPQAAAQALAKMPKDSLMRRLLERGLAGTIPGTAVLAAEAN